MSISNLNVTEIEDILAHVEPKTSFLLYVNGSVVVAKMTLVTVPLECPHPGRPGGPQEEIVVLHPEWLDEKDRDPAYWKRLLRGWGF